MSIVIGMHLGRYLLVAADTRMTWLPPGDVPFWRDGYEKIHRTRLGLIAGAGPSRLISAVEQRLASEEGDSVRHIDDVRRIVAEEWSSWSNTAPPAERQADGVSTAGWVTTYINPTVPPNERLRLAFIKAADGEGWLASTGDSLVLMPAGATSEEADTIYATLRDARQLPTSDEDVVESIRSNALLVGAVIQAVAENHESVSRSFQVAVETQDFLTGTSEIIPDVNTPFTLSLEPRVGPD